MYACLFLVPSPTLTARARFTALQFRHARTKALRAADVVVLLGVPQDFRMQYGAAVSGRATIIAVNRDAEWLNKNRTPTYSEIACAADFILRVAADRGGRVNAAAVAPWFATLREREAARNAQIAEFAKRPSVSQVTNSAKVANVLDITLALDRLVDDRAVLVADGGDFVGSAAYTLWPREPLGW